jgi:hypothetical protein
LHATNAYAGKKLCNEPVWPGGGETFTQYAASEDEPERVERPFAPESTGYEGQRDHTDDLPDRLDGAETAEDGRLEEWLALKIVCGCELIDEPLVGDDAGVDSASRLVV